jgi:hypothetical protein
MGSLFHANGAISWLLVTVMNSYDGLSSPCSNIAHNLSMDVCVCLYMH